MMTLQVTLSLRLYFLRKGMISHKENFIQAVVPGSISTTWRRAIC